MRVLVVEDDKDLNDFIRTALKREGFAADKAGNGKEALALARETNYDIVLLDMMMPELDGLSVLKELRKKGDPAAILMVTSQSTETDKLAGLNGGADDYLVKPFLISELIARIRAVLRRRQPDPEGTGSVLAAGHIRIDLVKHSVEVKGEPVELTKKEFELLEYLMRHPHELISKSQLESRVWGMDFTPGSNAVEVHINHLREKISSGKRPVIVTARGLGYRFEP
jgi:two-component system, OmpR family, response regulator